MSAGYEPTIFRQVICPCCGLQRGMVREVYGAQVISRRNAWDYTREPRPFGKVFSTRGKGTLKIIGEFGPGEDPDGYFPLVKHHLLSAVREWRERGWLTDQDLQDVLTATPLPASAAPQAVPSAPARRQRPRTVSGRREEALEKVTTALGAAEEVLEPLKEEIEGLRDSLEEHFSETQRFASVSEAADALDTGLTQVQESREVLDGIDFSW